MAKGKFLLGAVIGAAAGIIAGILSAPKSGKQTRSDLLQVAEEMKRKTNQTAAGAADDAGRAADAIKDASEQLTTAAADTTKKILEKLPKKPLGRK